MTERAADPHDRIESSHLHVDPEDEVRWEIVRPRSVLTSFWRGTYEEDPELRSSFLQAVTRPR
jgi:hypothetical protein